MSGFPRDQPEMPERTAIIAIAIEQRRELRRGEAPVFDQGLDLDVERQFEGSDETDVVIRVQVVRRGCLDGATSWDRALSRGIGMGVSLTRPLLIFGEPHVTP